MYALFEEVAGLDLKAIQSSLMVNKWTMAMQFSSLMKSSLQIAAEGAMQPKL